MAEKIIQEIFMNENPDKTTIIKEYTESELHDMIAPTVMINLYYSAQDPEQWIWARSKKNDDNLPDDDLPGELWRKCTGEYEGYYASNYGRIRDQNDKILPQFDTDAKYNAEQIKKMIDEINDRNDIGYLVIKGNTPVHRLVASAWLKKPKKKYKNYIKNGKYHVHHISNDGYDNTPFNLIYLPEEIHNGIKSGRLTGKIIPFHYFYPGPKIKTEME